MPTHRLYKTRGSHGADVFVGGFLVLHVLRKTGKIIILYNNTIPVLSDLLRHGSCCVGAYLSA